MTNREREILNIVRENPLISQDEIAKRLGITRSSVAVHITNLMKKGLILGKGYVLPQNEDYVYVIGAANVDMLGYPKSKLKLKDSNPGNLKISFGGVGRNIAENLARMGVKTKLLTLLGEDIYGRKIYDHAKKIGIDVSSVYFLEDKQTSTYISIQDEEGDMALALSCMDIYDEFKVDYIKENKGLIKNSKCIVVDTNLPEDVLKYISEEFEVPIFWIQYQLQKPLRLRTL
ncbi:PfkB family carbohydrate kinase [Caloramator sp. Dgby_cultured_2]|uniref:PfkB family carbohydrate kinase n=1 Tax=Caloramator sp. Dgby_cultured_2 TaxID=3029174 RepID=UPI00237E5FF1|nr:PfkB family carbohydrate kinase [Caloramator sp. Dgby_cultured_2]WDU83324.1 PfkB family carbohydrate kinase [Caloramator sp. Dgby_cultured_2]